MDSLSTVLQLAILVALGSLALFVRRYVPRYVERRAENLATKQDVAEITRRTEEAKLPFAEAIERLRADVQRETSSLTKRQELYIQLADALARVSLDGRNATAEEKREFLAAYSAAFLYAPDDVIQTLNQHLDLRVMQVALAADSAAQVQLQPVLQATLASFMLALRREAFHSGTGLDHTAFRFISFGPSLADPVRPGPARVAFAPGANGKSSAAPSVSMIA